MNQLYSLIGLLLLILFAGCKEQSIEAVASSHEVTTVNMSTYEDVLYKNKKTLQKWAIEQSSQTRSTESMRDYKMSGEMIACFLPQAFKFCSDLGLTKGDIEAMTGTSIQTQREYEEALIGIMLFSTIANSSLKYDTQIRGGSFKDCFLEATGIAAGVAIVTGLAKGVVSKAVVTATLKLAARVGGRTLNGIGLALLTAEITYCMWD